MCSWSSCNPFLHFIYLETQSTLGLIPGTELTEVQLKIGTFYTNAHTQNHLIRTSRPSLDAFPTSLPFTLRGQPSCLALGDKPTGRGFLLQAKLFF